MMQLIETIRYFWSVWGLNGNDVLGGGFGLDSILGSASGDYLTGGDGNDIF